jgi:hypothetical protein
VETLAKRRQEDPTGFWQDANLYSHWRTLEDATAEKASQEVSARQMTKKDPFDLWWEWAEKPLDSGP